MITNANILVTGGYGFIGAHISDKLSQKDLDNKITLLDRAFDANTTGNDMDLRNRENISILEASVTDPLAFEALNRNFDYIIHTAGFLGINAVAEQQLHTLDTNIRGTSNVLDFAASHPQKPFTLVFSTSEIYGVDAVEPAEDSPALIPTTGSRWCYAASKLIDEYYLKAYNQSHDIAGAIIRPFNVFGAHRYGTNAMTQLATRAVQGEPLLISGNGQQTRAWCHISDFANGVIATLEHSPRESIEAFNIGDNRNVLSMATLAKIIVKLAHSSSEIVILNNNIEDVKSRAPDIEKAGKMLNYVPTSNFESAVSSVINWVLSKEGAPR